MATSNPTSRLFTKESVLNIINNRKDYGIIGLADVGNRLKFTVQGNGNIIAATRKDGTQVESMANPGTVLMKKIWNLKAVSQVALTNPIIKEFLRKGLEAEAAGKPVEAHEYYNQYLNKVQISFSVLLPNTFDASNNDQIAGTVDLITNDVIGADGITPTGEKRQLLTIKDVSMIRLESAAKKTAAFMLSDLLGIPDADDASKLFQPANEIAGGVTDPAAPVLTETVPA